MDADSTYVNVYKMMKIGGEQLLSHIFRLFSLVSKYLLESTARTSVHASSNRSQDSELQLMEQAKRSRAEVERLRAEVEGAEEPSPSEEPGGEVAELRRQLLQAYIELQAAEDREYETRHRLKW